MKKQRKQGLSHKQNGNTSLQRPFPGKKKKTKLKKPLRLGAVLQGALQETRLKIDLDLFKIWSQWDELVGPAVARQTRPEAIKGTLLLVNVSSAPWLQELQFLKEDIKKKLNACLDRNAVQDIRFKVGPVDSVNGER